jgi:F420-dependent oxidoreductase-like protein
MSLSYTGGFVEAAEQVAALEKAGMDVVWVPEAYGFDAPSAMGYLAARTTRIGIGSGIMNVYSRSPTLLAMTAAGVDALSAGRCLLGIGASGPQVVEGFHGVAYDSPVERTREVVEICRQVWRRERVTHTGVFSIPLASGKGTGLGKPLKLLTTPVRTDIPVYVAALGERNVSMTAEVADGWLPLLFLPERAADVWGGALAGGAGRRDPTLGPLDVVAGGVAAIGPDVAWMRELVRPFVALYLGGMGARGRNFYNDLARRYGYEREAAEIQELYLSGRKEEAAAAVPAALVENTNLIGPEGWVRERLAAYREAGVTTLLATPVGPDQVRTVERLREWCE